MNNVISLRRVLMDVHGDFSGPMDYIDGDDEHNRMQVKFSP